MDSRDYGFSGDYNYTDMNIEIKGNKEVAADFKRMATETPDAIERIIFKVALNVERYGKNYSPVDTGLMRSTIYPVFKSKNETWVGPKTEYAKYVHARIPFMSAAKEDAEMSVLSIIKAEMRRVIK